MPDPSTQPAAASVLEALRGATTAQHKNLESSPAMARLFESDYSIAEYRAHLGRLLGLFEPLERAASQAADGANCDVPLERSLPVRSMDLREDLRLMGATESDIDSIERCQRLPLIPAAGLPGYTYVILGSTLGGRVIVKQLREVLGQGASFRFYGDESGRHQGAWASFRSGLEDNKKEDVEAICATAVGVFDAYAAWFAAPLS